MHNSAVPRNSSATRLLPVRSLVMPTTYRTGEPAEIANRIDQRDPARSGRAREERRCQGPERADRGFDPGEGQRQRGEGEIGIGEIGAQTEADRGGVRRGRDHAAPLAGAIRVAPDQQHDDRGNHYGIALIKPTTASLLPENS